MNASFSYYHHTRHIVQAGVLLLFFSCCSTVFSQIAEPQQSMENNTPNQQNPQDPLNMYKSIEELPHKITLGTLDNGLTVIVQENHVAPVATVRCYVRNTGSAFEGKYLGGGVSHVLEHVVAGGTTTKRSEKEIEHIVDAVGGATNAFTSKDLTAYFIDCPANDVGIAIELIGDSMQHIAFEPSEFDRELKVVQQELADGEVSRQRVLWSALAEAVYTTHPARHPIIGYIDVLKNISNDQIIDFYRQRYVPNNMVFVVVGDVDTEKVMEQVAAEFEGTPRGPETVVPMQDEPKQLAPREAIRPMDGPTYDFALAWPTIKLTDDDLYALDVAAYILSEGKSSRLVNRLVRGEQIALSVSSASYTPSYVNGYFAIFGSATPDKYQRSVDVILAEVNRLRTEPVSPAELARAKKQKAAELVFGQQTVQQAAEGLGRNYLSTGDPLFDEVYVAGIQKVTAEDVKRVADKYLMPDRMNKVVIEPKGTETKVSATAEKEASSEIQAFRLPNGVRVLLRKHSNLPMVTMQVFSLGACLADTPENAGRASLAASMLDKGTPRYNADQIAQYFDSIGGSFSSYAGRNTVISAIEVLKEDFPNAAAIMTECVLQPSMPQTEFEKMKMLALGRIAQRRANPQQEALEIFFDALPNGSPYHIIQGGTEASVEGLDVTDLQQYHNQYFVPQNMIVTVFGDIEIEPTLEMVKQLYGNLQPSPDFKPFDFNRPNAMAESKTIHHQTGKPTGIVMMGYPAVSISDAKDYAALTVLDAIMSGYSYPGGWLHNELRGEGLVYGVHAFLLTGPAPGYFIVSAQTSPDNVDEVVKRVCQNIEKAKRGEIDTEEFERSKQMIIALHSQENTTLSEQSQQAALDDLYGLGYNYDKSFNERIEAVTLEEVVAVAKKYLNDSLTVTASPAAPATDPTAVPANESGDAP